MKNIVDRFRTLNPFGKSIVILVIISLIAGIVALILSFSRTMPNSTSTTSVDPTSGLTIDDTNTGAIVDDGPQLVGIDYLRKRGLRAKDIDIIQNTFREYYANHKIENQSVKRVSFAQKLTHTIDNSANANSYILDIAFNTDKKRKLTIVVAQSGLSKLIVANPDGKNATDIFAENNKK